MALIATGYFLVVLAQSELDHCLLGLVHARPNMDSGRKHGCTSKSYFRLNSDPEKTSKMCVWLTSEPCRAIPLDLLQSVLVIAWDTVDAMTKPDDGQKAEGEGADDKPGMTFTCGTLSGVLASGG